MWYFMGLTNYHIGQHRTTWERIEPLRTMPSAENCRYSSCVIEAQTRWARLCGYITVRLYHELPISDLVHAWAAENFRNNAVIKSLSAARCNSRTVLLTLPARRGDFVITDIIQNSRLCVAGAMWIRLLKLPSSSTASLLVWRRFVLVFSAACQEQRSRLNKEQTTASRPLSTYWTLN